MGYINTMGNFWRSKMTMTYKELAEQLIFEGYFMPELSWQQYAEDLRWDWHINKEVLDQYAKIHNIHLEV